jgi:two-component system, cell cycle response regulator
MAHSTPSGNSLWLRLWQPFFNLSIYKKFLLVLASFLAGYLVIGVHSYVFIEKLKQELQFACGDQDHLSNALALLDTYITHEATLVILVMSFLSLTSFLCIRALVTFLDQMICSLKTLSNKEGQNQQCSHGTEIPIITRDRIGEVATLVNGLTSHIRDISLFRRTIEADESVEEVYSRLAHVFKETLHLNTFVIWEVRAKDDSIEPVYTWPPELEKETCIMSSSRLCRARRTGEVISSADFRFIRLMST